MHSALSLQFVFSGRHFLLQALGDRALRIDLQPQRIDAEDSALVHALLRALAPWLATNRQIDAVPAYASVCLRLGPGHDALATYHRLAAALQDINQAHANIESRSAERAIKTITLSDTPGLDAEWLADRLHMSVGALLVRFCAPLYRVAQIGFRAGFPYLLGLPVELATPRRATPRSRVPAGSVAIGGAQAGIYPSAGPGGWHVIAHTEQLMFNPQGFREQAHRPCWLQPGDCVRFVQLASEHAAHA
jgi:KipI family sensor histidine kinase inhibitor